MLLLPPPRTVVRRAGVCRLPGSPVVGFEHESASDPLRRTILRELGGTEGRAEKAVVSFGSVASAPMQSLSDDLRNFAVAPGGYALQVAEDGIAVGAATPAGMLYGAMTLSQLIREYGRTIPCLLIGDAPVLARRGVQLPFVQGHTAYRADYLRHLVPQLARWKINELYLYLESYFDFPSLPHMAGPGAMTLDNARSLDALCREYNIALIPMLNTLAHCGELLSAQRYNHLAEYPEGADRRVVRPFNLCASNPETHRVIDGMLDDLLGSFSASTIHVGGDEVSCLGECPRCRERGRGPFELYVEYYGRILARLSEAGRRGGIWGDMLLQHSSELPAAETTAFMAPLAGKAVIYDWHYSGGGKESLELFVKAGFTTIACSSTNLCYSSALWPGQRERQLELFRDAVDAHAEGGMTTAWANQFGLHEEQLSYLHGTGAALLWSGAGGNPAQSEPGGTTLAQCESAFALHRYGVRSTLLTDYLYAVGDIDGPVLAVLKPNHGVDLRKMLYHTVNVLEFWLHFCDRLAGPGLEKYRQGIGEVRRVWDRLAGEPGARSNRYFPLLQGPLLMHEHLLARYEASEAMYRAYDAAAAVQLDDPAAFADHLADAACAIGRHREDFPPIEEYLKRATDDAGLEQSSLRRIEATKKGIEELMALMDHFKTAERPLPAFQQLASVFLEPFRTRWYGDREHEWVSEPGRFRRYSLNEPGLWGAVPATEDE
jgi:hypothetical protein